MSSNNMNCIIDDYYFKSSFPGMVNWSLIIRLNTVPIKPENKAKTRYKTPISL